MAILYAQEAIDDLKEIIRYGYEQGHDDPAGYAAELMASLGILAVHPKSGRTGRVAGTRELVIAGTPYIAVYEIAGPNQNVRRVLHGSRRWP
ncbi:type II toxin-antitoxin system RelE/ParE family toxin [Xanthomonas nasturtii]|uniref:type II toxin-antitoxin system RelE/ParE family toxin n=1 Tax=Xanthomonas nasturtii TaxID=1843581 RepID=UPI002013A77E|nr:type II toxin-antitoxin system RelE/ParE family toxin [Xanthomonas nasturtii]MCL1574867.1 type II toxin-antitoxin system RelE/ParE family toxin [Xanthomonas nasturtii]MCL1586487.1 type II toxin-antitoxin system RelE/ParE family toxin [Xanthomonas nasturtii]